jgi:hypothetical protein
MSNLFKGPRRHNLKEDCFACFLAGRYAGWAFLIFGGVVGGLPKLGFASPSPFWEKTGTYLIAASLFMFAVSYVLRRSNRGVFPTT